MSKYVDFGLAGPFGIDIKPQFEHSMIEALEMEGLKFSVKEAKYPQIWGIQSGGSITSGIGIKGDRLYFGTADGQFYCVSFDGKQIWKVDVGNVISATPVFDDKSVYFACFGGNVYCVDLDGKEKWRFQAGSAIAQISPVDKDRIYFGTKSGTFYCLSNTADVLWKVNVKESVSSFPTFDENHIYFGCYDECLYCLSKSGEIVWKFKAKNPINTPTIYKDKLYANSFDGNYYCISKTGELVWKFYVGEPVSQKELATIQDGIVYFGAFDGCIYALSVEDGRKIWKYQTGDMVFASGQISKDIIYFGSTDNNLYALNKDNGEFSWKFQASAPLLVVRIEKEKIFVSSWDGNLYCLSAKGELLWKFIASTSPPSKVTIQSKIEFNRKIMDAEILNTPLGEVYRLSKERSLGNITHGYGSFGGTYIDREGKEYTGRKREGSTRYA